MAKTNVYKPAAIITFWVMLLLITTLQAQNTFSADVYTTEFGLPSNYIQACETDSMGYLWIATKKGICRYDGYTFQQYPALEGNMLSLAKRDKKEFVFYSNTSGLTAFNPYTKDVTKIASTQFSDDDPYNDHYNNIFTDAGGRVWCCDFAHVKYYDPATKGTRNFAISGYNNSTDKLATFTQPNAQEVWVASIFGLQVWYKNKDTLLPVANPALSHLNYSASAMVGADSLLLAAGNTIFLIRPSTRQVLAQNKIAAESVIVSVTTAFINGEKNMLLAAKDKLYAVAPGNFTPTELFRLGQYSGTINTVYACRGNAFIWLSTSQGLIKLTGPGNAVQQINLPATAATAENIVTGVLRQPGSNQYFVITSTGECYSTNLQKSWTKLPVPQPVNSIAFNGNAILLATAAGLYNYTGHGFVRVNIGTGDNTAFIKKAIVTQQYIWLLIKDRPVLILNRSDLSIATNCRVAANAIFARNNVWNDIIEDDRQQIFLAGWMPSGYGLALYDKALQAFVPISKRTAKESMFVGDFYNRITTSKRFHLLFTGYGGFNAINGQGVVTAIVSVADHKINNEHLEGIIEMPDGKIWFGTEEGIQVWNPVSDQLTLLSTQNGLPSNNTVNGFNMLDSNTIAIGFNKTISLIYTDRIFTSILQNRLVLSSLKINGEEKEFTGNDITIPPGERNLILSFSALNFSDAKKIQYQYRINSGNWQSLGHTPVITLSNFKPGSYVVDVRVADNTDSWQQQQLHFNIKALPRFYETTWFIILIIAVIAIAGAGLFLFRIKQLRRVDDFRAAISQDLHDDVGATLSSINILSAMLTERTELPEKPKTYVQRINTDVQQLQLKLDEIIWSMKKEQHSAQQLFEKLVSYGTFIFEAKHIAFRHHAAPGLNNMPVAMQNKRSIYLLVKEALNNIAKHSQANTATLNFELDKKILRIVIADNGIGIAPEKIPARYGIKGMYERAKAMHAGIHIDSKRDSGTAITLLVKL